MALVINGSTFSGSYNNLSDKPTIPTNTNQLTNGAGYITSAPAPTTSQVLSATASASAGAVGTYAVMYNDSDTDHLSAGGTQSSSSLYWGAASSDWRGNEVRPSGTWRILGIARNRQNNNAGKTSVWLRIS